MKDIWIERSEKGRKEREIAQEEYMIKVKKEQLKHSCENCGAPPPTRHHLYDGPFSGHYDLGSFSAWLCQECEQRMDDWYFDETSPMHSKYKNKKKAEEMKTKTKKWWQW